MAVMGLIMSRIIWSSLSKSVMLRLECKFGPLLASPFIFHELQPHYIHCRFGFSDPNHVGCINLQFLSVIRNELALLEAS